MLISRGFKPEDAVLLLPLLLVEHLEIVNKKGRQVEARALVWEEGRLFSKVYYRDCYPAGLSPLRDLNMFSLVIYFD